MSKLVVNRRSEWTNMVRDIELYLNDRKIADIKNGESKDFDLEPGTYKLKAEIDWCGSEVKELLIQENEVTEIELRGYSKNKWTVPYLILGQIILVVLSNIIEIHTFILTAYLAGLLMYIFYPITFGRNQYLKLENKSSNNYQGVEQIQKI